MAEEKKRKSVGIGLTATLQVLEKEFGKGILTTAKDKPDTSIPHWPTDLCPIDDALGIGGLPKGRIIEVIGQESSYKTTFLLYVAGLIQKRGGVVAFIDAEHALDLNWAKKLGVDIEELLVSQPDCGEDALEIVEALVRSGEVDFVIVDSVAALTPRAEIEGDMGDSHVGLQARMMGQACRKLTGAISKSETLVAFINQYREKIGCVHPETQVSWVKKLA